MNVIKVNKTNVKGSKREAALIEQLPYVNTSGKPASKLFARYKVRPKELLEICDEPDIPLGRRQRKDGRRTQPTALDHRQSWRPRFLAHPRRHRRSNNCMAVADFAFYAVALSQRREPNRPTRNPHSP